ncbi:hypothetical protein SLI_7717 [Streptomyces lividans 1326]|uniref:Uncharacterized protein n=1 Tax=Streptomyces lividans 1326 TaxID=1200984 RepID=A0A7U9E342_STRLI|nr:hypothetical protein SLI_7717 [Streptomyces lividans 1326]
MANAAFTTITRAEVAVATRIASAPRAESVHTTTGTATKPPPKPNSTVVTPVRSPIPSRATTSTQATPPARRRRPHPIPGTIPSRLGQDGRKVTG